MKITRRFAVASLLVIAVATALGAPAPASAGQPKPFAVLKLYPTADSPRPNATGTVAEYWNNNWSYAYWVVSVSKLAPNASYYTPVTLVDWGQPYVENVRIQTDAHGNGEGAFLVDYPQYIAAWSCEVYDASGTVVLTPNR